MILRNFVQYWLEKFSLLNLFNFSNDILKCCVVRNGFQKVKESSYEIILRIELLEVGTAMSEVNGSIRESVEVVYCFLHYLSN